MYEFEVPGEIVGKGRPRMNTFTGAIYTPNKTKFYEAFIKNCFVNKYPTFRILAEEEIKVTIIAYFDIPKNKNISKKKREKMLNNEIRPTKKPDIDNITKVVLDALNEFVYHDDTQIVELDIKKYYSAESKVYVKVEVI